MRGLSIALAIKILSIERKFFHVLFRYVLFLSVLYSVVAIRQLNQGCLVPGIGGATYQTASYFAATFSLVLFSSNYFIGRSNIFYRIFIILIALMMVFALFYNGGRGALLVLLFYFIGALYCYIKDLFLGKLNIYKVLFPVFVIIITTLFTVPLIYNNSILFSSSFVRGFSRTIEIFTSLFLDGIFLSESVSYRDYVFIFIIDSIMSSPIFGYGPYWSTRVLTPSHNIILDLFIQYGFIIGVFIIFILYIDLKVSLRNLASI